MTDTVSKKCSSPRQAMGGHGRRRPPRIQWIIPEDVTHPAGVDVLRFQLRQDFLFDRRAMAAGERGVFHQLDGRIGIAERHVVGPLGHLALQLGGHGGLRHGKRGHAAAANQDSAQDA
jgi:hypothetical protein